MNNCDLTGKWAVVTGADGGIGTEFCRVLAGRGCSLVMVSVTVEPLRRAAIAIESEFGVKALPLTLDLTAPHAESMVAAFLGTNGIEADFVINNAGIFSFRELADTSDEKIRCFIDLHVRATTMLSLFFARKFRQRGCGRILNMSSMSCWMPMPGLAMYTSTKAYIRVFTRSLHYELKDYGASATVAAPGGIATSLFGLPDHLMRIAVGIGAVAKPDRFAERAVNAMLKGKKQYINGIVNRLAIFFVGITPTWIRMQVKRRLLDKGIVK
ncbi:MAG: SDR family NAD(P)-dependent oxidoreductase [Muribaculaceae bacterium]|nr:SDR family NAD(P)-dependent oxidoreductase [Muribaculaceae bacterium]